MLDKIYLILVLLFLFPPLLFGEKLTPVIRVINDEGKGVKSELSKKDRGNNDHRLGLTDDEGYKKIDIDCESGERICALPIDPNYYETKCECPIVGKREIKVTRKDVLVNLETNAICFERREEYAKAAMIYNEIFIRAAPFDEKKAEEASAKVYQFFGKVLKNYEPTIYDPIQGKTVISPSLKADIKKFQRINNINDTGIIDYATLSKASGANIRTYLFHRCNILQEKK